MGFSLGQFLLEGVLSFRQYKVLQQKTPPKVLAGEVSQKVYDQSQVWKCATPKHEQTSLHEFISI